MTLLKPTLPLALALLALAAPAASAGTATLTTNPGQSPGAAVYVAAPGEVNDVTVSYSPGGDIVFGDVGAPVTAGEGCRSEAPDRAVCDPGSAETVSATVIAGDGSDRVAVTTAGLPAALADVNRALMVAGGEGDDVLTSDEPRTGVILDGEEGADRLTGGPGSDGLYGGPGADVLAGGEGNDRLDGDGPLPRFVEEFDPPQERGARGDDAFDGGPGTDTVDYGNKTVGVTVDLRAGVGGQPGETDRYTGIENASGSPRADVLRGTDGPNVLDGGFGRFGDRIDGRGGDDRLSGSGTDSRITCGAGSRDFIDADDTYISVVRRKRPRRVPGDCERVSFADGAVSLPLRERRGVVRLRLKSDPDSERQETGKVSLLRAGRVIGTTRLRRRASASRFPRIRLTPAGRRAMARRRTLTVGLLFSPTPGSRDDVGGGVDLLSVQLRR